MVIVFDAKVASNETKAPAASLSLNSITASIFSFVIALLSSNLTFSSKVRVGFVVALTFIAPCKGRKATVGAVVSPPTTTVPSAVKLSKRLFPTVPPAPC